MSNRAAVEKKEWTLEKHEEDQSKYYFNYSKPPVSDIRWANRDIVLKQANIPNCSTLDDIVTPLGLIE